MKGGLGWGGGKAADPELQNPVYSQTLLVDLLVTFLLLGENAMARAAQRRKLIWVSSPRVHHGDNQ